MQAVRAEVGGEPLGGVRPCLGDEGPVAEVLVGYLAPGAVDVVDLVAVPEGVSLIVPRLCQVRQFRVLDEAVCHVDTEAVHAALEPEPQDGLELRVHIRVLPVEVRLLGGEEVQVPLAVGHPGPGGAAEAGVPVAGRQGTVGAAAGAEDVPLAFGASGACRQRGLEPGVLVGGVVGGDVRDDPDPVRVRLLDEQLRLGDRAE